ncbi:MAG: DUF1343 domain-containing protein [bacterium]|nr:DUF1343 domain-containing protein [Candidatus Kapabacteria bacterium]
MIVLSLLTLCATANAQVLPGIDVLANNDFRELQGKRVGLVMNQTAVRRDARQTTLDAFLASDRCRLVALFAPEHGIDGAVLAGDDVADQVEPKSGLVVHSLYGATKKPSRTMLKNIDVMVYDIQDIGVRSYTFISTLVKVMEGCAEAGLPLVVLDRPNPLGGEMVDGPVLDPAFNSFVGVLPIPYVYGLTAGELATMANAEGWLDGGVRCSLTVIRVQGWQRSMDWRETGLQWIPPSPHVPTPEAAFGLAATGAIGEISVMSIGIGYTLPFELIGAPWMDGRMFASHLNEQRVAGIYFRPTTYKPFYGFGSGSVCSGAHVMRTGVNAAPFSATVVVLAALRDVYRARSPFAAVPEDRWKMFDKICGGSRIREELLAGTPASRIIEAWGPGLREYLSKREGYLLYE